MSLLKQKLAKKLTLLLGYEIGEDDIYFPQNGGRRDVVRWSTSGYECFSAAAFSARKDVTLKIADEPQPYGVFEIFAEQQITGDKPVSRPKKIHPFDTSFR